MSLKFTLAPALGIWAISKQLRYPAQAEARPGPKFDAAVTLNPMFEKRFKRGEDNFVKRDRFICVTDGVGGWIRKLVDTGLFTKEYVVHVADLYDKGEYANLKELLDKASKMTKAKGSTTCVMAELKEGDFSTLHTCNLGDSGYILLRPRNGKVDTVFKSETQQHRFNAPY